MFDSGNVCLATSYLLFLWTNSLFYEDEVWMFFVLLKLDLESCSWRLLLLLLLKALHKSGRIWKSDLRMSAQKAFEHEGGCHFPQNTYTLPSSFQQLKSSSFFLKLLLSRAILFFPALPPARSLLFCVSRMWMHVCLSRKRLLLRWELWQFRMFWTWRIALISCLHLDPFFNCLFDILYVLHPAEVLSGLIMLANTCYGVFYAYVE